MTNEELYTKAVESVRERGEATAKILQRHLNIGYSLASHLLDMMEQGGVVSQPDTIGRRTVLKNT